MTNGNGGTSMEEVIAKQARVVAYLRKRAVLSWWATAIAAGVYALSISVLFDYDLLPWWKSAVGTLLLGALIAIVYVAGIFGGEYRALRRLYLHYMKRERKDADGRV